MRQIKFKKSEFLYLARFASNEPTRPHLGGVWFDESGEMVATDGHRLGVLGAAFAETIPDGETGAAVNFLIRTDKRTIAALKQTPFEDLTLEIEPEAESGRITAPDGSSVSVFVDWGHYPNYKKVIPTGTVQSGPAKIRLNADYLRDFIFDKKTKGVWIEFTDADPRAPVRINVEGLQNFTGVLMPMLY